MKALPLLASAALVFAACGDAPPSLTSDELDAGNACTCKTTFASAGIATLHARTSNPDDDAGYEAAVISFKYGSTDEAVTNNRWDLLFGNDKDPSRDELRVNTVVGDDSYIVDLGEMKLSDVPPVVLSSGDTCDDIDAIERHLYYVRSQYDDTRQVAVFGITKHTLNESIDISWFRSTKPDAFDLSTTP